ncbi:MULTISPECIES: hypothetical protein [Streptosporangium]|uniref:Uncharacterized protein n=1 Tax=Streptosporangium brasiliense TaxID=47480 RepID=A0ABT9R690_9ACTN|nr:hypothetical protein [Streptosporangium brasiliense]MDP9864766.1 hypothetical protein [Streptosporangium brasiliense]
MNDVDRLVAGIVPDPGPGMTPGARELFDEITAVPAVAPGRRWPRLTSARPAARGRSQGRWNRRWLSVPAVAGLAAAAMITGWVLPGGYGTAPASASLDIKRAGGYYVITVKDLYADPKMYERELNARGLDIRLLLEPTSPSIAGRMFVMSGGVEGLRQGRTVPEQDSIRTIEAPGPCSRFGGCPIGLRVPVDFKARGEILLGRVARPGERYTMPPGIDTPGEPFHCVDYVNKTVDKVRAMLRQRGVEPEFTHYGARKGEKFSMPGGWYVHDGVMSAAGEALLLAGPTANDAPRPRRASCPRGS